MNDFMQVSKLVLMGLMCMGAQGMLSLILTRICIAVLPYFGMVDIPHGRHQHRQPVPRGGGIAIILSFICVMSAVVYFMGDLASVLSKANFVLQLAPPVLLVGILGVLDDKFELGSVTKLIFQIVIAIYFFFTGAGITSIMGYSLPLWIGVPLTVVWLVVIINAFNLIDGMDGLAAGLASISSFSMGIWCIISNRPILTTICMLVFCGSCLGFLKYNFSPARIFMGDTGSLFLGLIFAYFSMAESARCITLTGLLVPVLAMGIPIFDVFLAIVRRMYRKYIMKEPGVGIMTGDHDHLHHRLQKSGKDQKKTAIYLYTLAVALVAGAVVSALVSDLFQTLSYAVLMCIIFATIRLGTIEFFDVATLFSEGFKIPHKRFILLAVHPVMDFFLMSTAYAMTSVIYSGTICFDHIDLKQYLFCLAPFPIILILSGIYKIYWLRASLLSYFRMFKVFFIASVMVLVSGFAFVLIEHGGRSAWMTQMNQFLVTYLLIGMFLIFAERFFLNFIGGYYLNRLKIINDGINGHIQKTVVYGGGQTCKIFLALENNASNCNQERNVIGIIDDNVTLRGLNVYGIKVLGTSEDLESLKETYSFDEIVITLPDLPEESRRKIYDFGKQNHVHILEFRYELVERQN